MLLFIWVFKTCYPPDDLHSVLICKTIEFLFHMSVNGITYVSIVSCIQLNTLLQFKKTPPKVPYKAIALATFLFLIGSVLIIIGSLLLAGYINVTVSRQNCSIVIEKDELYLSLCFTAIYGLIVAPRSHNSSPHHRRTDLSSWILSFADCLLCFQGLPWLFLR